MSEVVPSHGQKGNFGDLKKNTIDPSDIDQDEFIKSPDPNVKVPNPRFGKPRFLTWIFVKPDEQPGYWEAKTKDGKVFREELDETQGPKKSKITQVT